MTFFHYKTFSCNPHSGGPIALTKIMGTEERGLFFCHSNMKSAVELILNAVYGQQFSAPFWAIET